MFPAFDHFFKETPHQFFYSIPTLNHPIPTPIPTLSNPPPHPSTPSSSPAPPSPTPKYLEALPQACLGVGGGGRGGGDMAGGTNSCDHGSMNDGYGPCPGPFAPLINN